MALRYVEGYKVPKVSESKGAEKWLISIDRVLDDPGLSYVPGAAPRGVCTVLSHSTWYHGTKP